MGGIGCVLFWLIVSSSAVISDQLLHCRRAASARARRVDREMEEGGCVFLHEVVVVFISLFVVWFCVWANIRSLLRHQPTLPAHDIGFWWAELIVYRFG